MNYIKGVETVYQEISWYDAPTCERCKKPMEFKGVREDDYDYPMFQCGTCKRVSVGHRSNMR